MSFIASGCGWMIGGYGVIEQAKNVTLIED